MVSVFDSGSSSPGSSPGRENGVVFLEKTLTLYSHSTYPSVQMGTGEFIGTGNTDELASHPGGSTNIPGCFMLQKQVISASLTSHVACR